MNFFQKYKWLIPMQLFIGALLLARLALTQSITFLFLPWNLFLAVIPLYFSFRLSITTNKKAAILLLSGWLLFFPNSLYIITDIFHLGKNYDVPMWFDLLILFSSAISGIIVGFLSMQHVERYLSRHINKKYIPYVLLSFFMLCGYGIYLGRYMRWNSWDIVAQPFALLLDIIQDIRHPIRNFEGWMLTLLFGTWMYILYRYFKKLRHPSFAGTD